MVYPVPNSRRGYKNLKNFDLSPEDAAKQRKAEKKRAKPARVKIPPVVVKGNRKPDWKNLDPLKSIIKPGFGKTSILSRKYTFEK